MKKFLIAASSILIKCACALSSLTAIAAVFPGATWEVKTPVELGLDSSKLDQLASSIGGHGVIVKDGYLVKTWGTASLNGDWASAGKPVISTLLFFAEEEGKITGVDELVRPHVLSYFGQDLIVKDQTMTFRHLANMISGYALPEVPGSAWGYNDYAIKLYATLLFDEIYQDTADNVVKDIGRLGKLQFEDGSIFGSRGGYGLNASPRDFARLGWFWLNKGNWNGEQLLPVRYFDSYMKSHTPSSLPRTSAGTNDYLSNGSFGGGTDQTQFGPGIYAFNWWLNPNQATWPSAPVDTIHASGHWNRELLFAIPSLGVVIAARGDWGSWTPGTNSELNQKLQLLVEAIEGIEPLPIDTDGDGVTDDSDNCSTFKNPNQYDSDGDGFGNRCDADLDQSGFVNSLDLGLFKNVFFTTDTDADFNGDGIVNSLDLGLMKNLLFKSVGPGAVAP